MKRLILPLIVLFVYSNLIGQSPETARKLVQTPSSLSVTVWNDGFFGPHHEPSLPGSISWNGINGVYGASFVFGTKAAGAVNGIAGLGAYFIDMVNVQSNFGGGFTEETVEGETFDKVTTAVIRDDNATHPYGLDVIQKTYSKSGFNVVFCRNGYVNTTSELVTDFYSGFGGDWEIGNSDLNSGGVDSSLNLVYTFEPGTNKPYFGFVALKNLAGCRVFTTKYSTVNALRTAMFNFCSTINTAPSGLGDVVNSIGSSLGNIAIGDTAWSTFAIIGGNDLEGLKDNARLAFKIANSAGWTDKNVVPYSGDKIINVPDDQPTIQAGIDASVDGDTVLVADGTYLENINFNGKAITVASHLAKDNDTNHINNTIISAHSGTIVQFNSGEDTTSVLYGFTITGGIGSLDPYGYGTMGAGGIGVNNAGAKIKCNKITGNIITHNSDAEGGGIIINANSKDVLILENFITNNKLITSAANSEGGGGIFLYNCNSHNITIAKNIIADNIVSTTSGALAGYGGAIYLNSSKALIRNNLIKNNSAQFGGGISIDDYPSNASPDFINNTIVNNIASFRGGGIYANYVGVSPKMINSILWGNTAPSDSQLNTRVLTEYSNIQSGFAGTGNIDQNPLFLNEDNCSLNSGSPCIDAGCPETIYDDLDGTTNDMGCYGGNSPLTPVTDVKEITNAAGIPNKYKLSQNYPNPFNPTTTINYSIPLVEFGFVPTTHLAIYDILGQEVEILINKKQNPGNYEVTWNAGNLTSGVYFCRLQVGSFIETRKMILLR